MKKLLLAAAAVTVLGFSSDASAWWGGDNDDANDNDNNNQSVIGQDNDDNTIVDFTLTTDDITIDLSTRAATSTAALAGTVSGNQINNSSNAEARYIAYAKAKGNEISIGGNGVTNTNESGISVVQASSGFNNLNQTVVQVSAQASFNSCGCD
jgi:hypothetical protein